MSFLRDNFHVTVDLRLCEFSICFVFKSIQDLGIHCKNLCYDVVSATKTTSEEGVRFRDKLHSSEECI